MNQKQNFSDYVLQKQLELQPQNNDKTQISSYDDSMKVLSMILEDQTDKNEVKCKFDQFKHNKRMGESTVILTNNKIQIREEPFTNDQFQEIFKKSINYQQKLKCPMQDFQKIKQEALKNYTDNMENIHTKMNKEPKILDQHQRIDRCVQDASTKLKSIICENSVFYQNFDHGYDIESVCDQLLQYSYGRIDTIQEINLNSDQFKKLICYTAQALRSCKVLSEQEISQPIGILEQYKDNLYQKKSILQNQQRVKQIETHFNDLVLKDELQNINKLYFNNQLYENHNVTYFLTKLMTNQADMSRLRQCHILNLNEAQFYLFKHYYQISLQACSLNLREISLVISYLEQTKNEIINKKDNAFVIIKDLDKQDTLDNFCIMFEKSSKKYPELHKAFRLHNQQATHNHLKLIFTHLLKQKMYKNYQLKHLHEKCGITKPILKQFESTLQEILLNYKVHQDEISLILQSVQKLSQPLQGKDSIYKTLKKRNLNEQIPNQIQKKITQDKKLIKLFASDQESLFHDCRMLKVLYSNHDIYSNQDLIYSHKDLKIDNSVYDSYCSHFVESLKQCNLSQEMIKEMGEYIETKRKFIVQ